MQELTSTRISIMLTIDQQRIMMHVTALIPILLAAVNIVKPERTSSSSACEPLWLLIRRCLETKGNSIIRLSPN